MLKKMEKNVRAHPCLTLLGMGKLPGSDPLCFTWSCWPGKFLGKDFHSPSWLTVSKALVRFMKAAYRPMFFSLHFSCICLCMNIMSAVPLLDLNPLWLSCVLSFAIIGMSLFSLFCELKLCLQWRIEWCFNSLNSLDFSALLLYRATMTAFLKSCGRGSFSL